MTALAEASLKEIEQAIYNCYPTPVDKIGALIHYKCFGVFPFNPSLN